MLIEPRILNMQSYYDAPGPHLSKAVVEKRATYVSWFSLSESFLLDWSMAFLFSFCKGLPFIVKVCKCSILQMLDDSKGWLSTASNRYLDGPWLRQQCTLVLWAYIQGWHEVDFLKTMYIRFETIQTVFDCVTTFHVWDFMIMTRCSQHLLIVRTCRNKSETMLTSHYERHTCTLQCGRHLPWDTRSSEPSPSKSSVPPAGQATPNSHVQYTYVLGLIHVFLSLATKDLRFCSVMTKIRQWESDANQLFRSRSGKHRKAPAL